MADLKIDTDRVEVAAANIEAINNTIRDGARDVLAAVKQLDQSWDGSASEQSTNKFNRIMSESHRDARYKVMNNYVNFLRQRVETGYIQTEETNTSLADAFK